MFKLLVSIALLFAVLVSTDAFSFGRGGGPGPGRGGGHHGESGSGEEGSNNGGGSSNWGQWLSGLCNNQTVADLFPTTIQAVITALQSNGSFSGFLAIYANSIAYIENATNTALISSNCSAYVSGLQSALQADQNNLQLQQSYIQTAFSSLVQAIQSLTGKNGYNGRHK